MYKQMKKFITSGLIVVTLLLMVAVNADADYIYNWHPDEGEGASTVGQLRIDCDAWDGETIEKVDLTYFYYKDSFGTDWGLLYITGFTVLEGDEPGSLLVWDKDGVGGTMTQYGFHTAAFWGMSVSEVDSNKQTSNFTGTWIMDRAHDDCNPVPEPATLTLLGIGIVGLIGGAARKKLKKKKAVVKT